MGRTLAIQAYAFIRQREVHDHFSIIYYFSNMTSVYLSGFLSHKMILSKIWFTHMILLPRKQQLLISYQVVYKGMDD
jgi:hypothetical protein